MRDNSIGKEQGGKTGGEGTLASFERTEAQHGRRPVEKALHETSPASDEVKSTRRNLVIVGLVALIALLIIFWVYRSRSRNAVSDAGGKTTEAASGTAPETPSEVVLPTEALAAAGIEIAGVTQRPAVALLTVTGSVEANQQQMQQVTPLVGGRVERVNVALGDHVRAGTVLATIASPQIAEMRGNLRAAETKLSLAERNLARVQRSENRVAVLSAKAKLDEAEATLRRTRRLIELGVGAGKDLVAAEAAYKTAKAEYEFQDNIALNREVQQAQAEVETSRTEVAQIRQGLNALGAATEAGGRNSSLITVRAPVSGPVIERLVNPGAGMEAGKPLFTVANLSTVWVIAKVAEAQVGSLRLSTPAEVRSAALGSGTLAGSVNYIDPQLDE
jgi:cobalt-zinc-cadmium efflux system membrane fusion protein